MNIGSRGLGGLVRASPLGLDFPPVRNARDEATRTSQCGIDRNDRVVLAERARRGPGLAGSLAGRPGAAGDRGWTASPSSGDAIDQSRDDRLSRHHQPDAILFPTGADVTARATGATAAAAGRAKAPGRAAIAAMPAEAPRILRRLSVVFCVIAMGFPLEVLGRGRGCGPATAERDPRAAF